MMYRLPRFLKRLLHLCECCGAWRGVKSRPSMTQYPWDGKGEDPNRVGRLCEACWSQYHDYWQERWDDYWQEGWDEYWGGRL